MIDIVVTFFEVEVDLFNDVFSLLVFLTTFVRLGIGPADHRLTSLTKDIAHTMQTSDEEAIFGRTDSDIDTLVKEIGPTMPSVKAL